MVRHFHRVLSLVAVQDDSPPIEEAEAEAAGIAGSSGLTPVKRQRQYIAPHSVERESQAVDDQYHESSKEASEEAPRPPSLEEYLEIKKYEGVEWDRLPNYLKVRRFIEWKGTESPEDARKRRIEELERMRQWKAQMFAENRKLENASASDKQAIQDTDMLSDDKGDDSDDNLRRRKRVSTKGRAIAAKAATENVEQQSTEDERASKPTSAAQTLLEIVGKGAQDEEMDPIEEQTTTSSAPISLEMSSSVHTSKNKDTNPFDNAPKSTTPNKAPATETFSSSQGKTDLRSSSSSSQFESGFSTSATKESTSSPSGFSFSRPAGAFSFSVPAAAVAASAAIPLGLAAASSTNMHSFGHPTKPSAAIPSGSVPVSAFAPEVPPKLSFGLPPSTGSGFGKSIREPPAFGSPAASNTYTNTISASSSPSRTPSPDMTPEPSSQVATTANVHYDDYEYYENGEDDVEIQPLARAPTTVEIYEDQDDEDAGYDEDAGHGEYDENDDIGDEQEDTRSWADGSEAQGEEYDDSRYDSPADPDADSDKENQGPPVGWNSRSSASFPARTSSSQSPAVKYEETSISIRSSPAARSNIPNIPKTPDFKFDFGRLGQASTSKNTSTSDSVSSSSSLSMKPAVADESESIRSGELRVGAPVNPGYMGYDGWRFKGDTIDTISDYERAPLVCDDETFYTDQGRISPLPSPELPSRSK